MSRKSRLTHHKERLEKISECPFDLLNKVDPDDDTFDKIERAEGGDISATDELAAFLLDVYKDEELLNASVLYYIERGLALGSEKCAATMLECIDIFNEQFDSLDRALGILEGKELGEEVERLITRVKVKRIINSAEEGADHAELDRELADIGCKCASYARLYIASRRLADTGSYDKDVTSALADELGVPGVVALPVFTGGAAEALAPADTASECESMKLALALLNMDEWRDFWLRAAYEYADLYLGGDLLPFAEDMMNAISARCDYAEKKLHVLAFKKLLSDFTDKVTREEYEALAEECRFDGLTFDLSDDNGRNEMMRNAIYTSSKDERQKKRMALRLGDLIIHTKNRYFLGATMTNHQKRGCKHLWDVTVSIETDSDTPPEMNPARIYDRKNEVSRGGVTLEKEKKLSQVFCAGEIRINDRVYPLEIDLIVDISYVSSTKCEYCEIKVKEYEREGKYLIMQALLAIY